MITAMDFLRTSTTNRLCSSVLSTGLLSFCLSGCANAIMTESGHLSTYAGLKSSDGILTKTKQNIDAKAVLAAKSLRLVPATVDKSAIPSGLSPPQLKLVSNAINRSLCRDLSRRFIIVAADQPADLVVNTVITNILKTDTVAAILSVVSGIGGSVASAATGIKLPPIPRIPLGLGSLTVEAEAKDPRDRQLAAFIWARGADAILTNARVAEEADAYTLAAEFSADFANLLNSGGDPIADRTPHMPTIDTISEYFGDAPKFAACAQFGSHPGLGGTIGSQVGLPPSWTDKGPDTSRTQ